MGLDVDRGRTISHRGSRPMPRPSYTRGQLNLCSPIPATSLGSLAHLAVSMATGKTQTSPRARLNGSKPRTWFRPPGGRRGRNGYHGMPAVRSKHASPVDHCSRSRTHQAPMFVPVSIPLQAIKEIPIVPNQVFLRDRL